jgi:hypothetical protein
MSTVDPAAIPGGCTTLFQRADGWLSTTAASTAAAAHTLLCLRRQVKPDHDTHYFLPHYVTTLLPFQSFCLRFSRKGPRPCAGTSCPADVALSMPVCHSPAPRLQKSSCAPDDNVMAPRCVPSLARSATGVPVNTLWHRRPGQSRPRHHSRSPGGGARVIMMADEQPLAVHRLRLLSDQPVEGCELVPDVFMLNGISPLSVRLEYKWYRCMDKMACSWCGKTPVVMQRLTDDTYFCSTQCFVNAWQGHAAQHRTRRVSLGRRCPRRSVAAPRL